ncbi:MAG: flagellar hook-length control protein FliK [Tabrizicola sp.]
MTAVIEAASNAFSEKGLSVADAGGSLATDPAPEPRNPPAPSASLAWSREQLGDLFTNALPQWVFSDWQSALSEADQRPELSFSSLSVLSAGPASGTPTAGATGPNFPVPQIASQLATVLVRNETGMTELALAPEELGKVRLRMEPDSVNPDRIIILISVERPETLDLFRRHAGELAEAIRSAGYSGADIGFGQNSQDGGSGHRKEPASAGPGLAFDEVGPAEAARLHTLGVSLDLRL